MYNEIDLHNLDYKVALALFKKSITMLLKEKIKEKF